MGHGFGQQISGLTVDGRELRAAVFDENAVRAAAGVTLVLGAVAFSVAYFDREYALLQATSAFFLVEFTLRVMFGLRYSPVGVVTTWMTSWREPDWVSAKPKLFAWKLALGMAFAMTIITNVGIRGYLPRTMCGICMTLMWLESALGLCLGCKTHALLVRRGWASRDPAYEICSGGECALPVQAPPA